MASLIPASNPAGNNQTNPLNSVLGKTTPIATAPGVGVQNNPYMPAGGTSTVPTSPAAPVYNAPSRPQALTTSTTGTGGSSGAAGFITDKSSYSSGENDLQKQLIEIYGKGVGGSLYSLLSSMSGTDSKVLQEYIASLQPQMAKAQADVNATLGAGGVSANSSVAAIADANLQAQEQAAIAGESAKLTLGQEELTANLLQGMQGASAKEVASSGWDVFANVIDQITGDIGNLLPMSSGNKTHTNTSSTSGSTGSAPLPGIGSDPFDMGNF